MYPGDVEQAVAEAGYLMTVLSSLQAVLRLTVGGPTANS